MPVEVSSQASFFEWCSYKKLSMDYITGIVSFISGGGLLAIGQYFIQNKTNNITEFSLLIERYKVIVETQDIKINDLEKLKDVVQDLRDELSRMKSKILILESHYVDYPFPAWLNDINGVIIAMNDPFEEEFLLPSGKTISQSIGKTYYDIWPKDLAESYSRHDKIVLKGKQAVWTGDENIVVDGVDNSKSYRIIKFKRFAGGVVIGTGGFAIPIP